MENSNDLDELIKLAGNEWLFIGIIIFVIIGFSFFWFIYHNV